MVLRKDPWHVQNLVKAAELDRKMPSWTGFEHSEGRGHLGTLDLTPAATTNSSRGLALGTGFGPGEWIWPWELDLGSEPGTFAWCFGLT